MTKILNSSFDHVETIEENSVVFEMLEALVDEESEISDADFLADRHASMGSVVYAIDTQAAYILNSSGTWVKQ